MEIKKSAPEVWSEFEKGKSYNKSIDLYDNVKKCENFYIGRQWEGLNAPDLPKPVFNIVKRVVSYFTAMIVSDDVGARFEPYSKTKVEVMTDVYGERIPLVKEELDAKVIETEVDKTIERCDIKTLARKIVRNAAVDGDAFLYFYYDPSVNAGYRANGGIATELIDNTNVIFGNPYRSEVQNQPYIIIATPRLVEDVRDEAKKSGMKDDDVSRIHADDDYDAFAYRESGRSDLCTVLTKLWREDGTIHAIKVTKDFVLREEWDTKYERYPIANMIWEEIKNSYHGNSAVLPVIPNQICVNQMYAMSIHQAKTCAVQKLVYDSTKISSWSNKVGQAIGVIGNPNDVIAYPMGGMNMNPHMTNLINTLKQDTEEYMGASDAALGNVKPDNMGAIIATQNASAMPLELQRREYYRCMEECIRIIIDIIRADYGSRKTSIISGDAAFDVMFDFATLDEANYNMKIDVGQSSYWSELTQIQTADNLLAKGVIPDAITYLESIPDKYIRNKSNVIKKLKEMQTQQAQMAEAQQMPAAPAEMIPEVM